MKKAREIVEQMTIDEKIDMLSGSSLFAMNGNKRFDLPVYPVSDGPHGVKLLKFGEDMKPKPLGKVTCFPTACALANTWNRTLVREMGELLGEEAQLEGTGVSLGPAVNIKRHPLCGRNFEYYSEDPYLAGELGTEAVKGVQNTGMPVCLKHFAANNQEYRRTTINEIIDERTFREIYLSVFEKIIKTAKPKSVMCAYNKINGIFSSENKKLLTDILRTEWGFDGMVLSDWGAVHDRVAAVKAGMDLEMPGGQGIFDEQLRAALADGSLTEKEIDICVERIVSFILNIKKNKWSKGEINQKLHHKRAQDMARECLVLLKNDGILPLNNTGNTAVIGSLAKEIRYQGGGSSMVMNQTVDEPLEEILKFEKIKYADGYPNLSDEPNENLEQEAIKLAESCERIIYFIGLTYGYESEDYDRYDMKLPKNQIQLLSKLHEKNPNIIVVLEAGSAVEMEWESKCRAILYASLAGEGEGRAIAEILYGKENPSGKLAETFPMYLENTPAYLSYPGKNGNAEYTEGLYVGYRYYDKKRILPRYPFGYGKSYTFFEYSNIKLDKKELTDKELLTVSCEITNAGSMKGKEIVQLYVQDLCSTVDRPVKELKGFKKIDLEPGETKIISFVLDKTAFAYYETRIKDWHVESGEFQILIGASSMDLRLKDTVNIFSTAKIPHKYTEDTLFYELMGDKNAYHYVSELTEKMPAANLPGYDHPVGPMGMDKKKQRQGMTLGKIATGDGANAAFLSQKELTDLLNKINEEQ